MEEKKLLHEEELGIAAGTMSECVLGADKDVAAQGGIADIPPKDRDIAMVFQQYALYPHMTVFDSKLPASAERIR